MFSSETQRRTSLLVSVAIAAITIFVTPFSTLDPINVPKLWLLLTFSLSVGFVLLHDLKTLIARKNWIYIFPGLALILFMLITMITSGSPMSQQLFGAFGRNTGLLTYLSFVILFIGTAIVSDVGLAKRFLIFSLIAVSFNAGYGLLQATGNDPIKWNNSYNSVIGTVGNPNFMAALLGMGVALVAPFILHRKTALKFKVWAGIYIAVALFDILKSDAQQGIIVSLLALGLTGYFWIRSKSENKLIKYGYLASGVVATLVGILGTLQKGPLASIIYKPSVTYRGDYWHAGLEMFTNKPLFGVGLDSYGDWYRATRTLAATVRRGPSTVSNAAHNVFIDFAATSGIFTLLAYLVVIFLGFRATWRITKRSKDFDPFVTAVFVAWVGYLVQSVISINNIGLAIWGWVLPGLLIAMDRWTVDQIGGKKSESKPAKKRAEFTGIAMTAGFVIGGVIGYMPFSADAHFRYSIETGKADVVQEAAKKWPTDATRLMYAANIFATSKLDSQAVDLARAAVKENPRAFDAWMFLYNSTQVSGNEKREILDRMKQLDPHNPDLAKLG